MVVMSAAYMAANIERERRFELRAVCCRFRSGLWTRSPGSRALLRSEFCALLALKEKVLVVREIDRAVV